MSFSQPDARPAQKRITGHRARWAGRRRGAEGALLLQATAGIAGQSLFSAKRQLRPSGKWRLRAACVGLAASCCSTAIERSTRDAAGIIGYQFAFFPMRVTGVCRTALTRQFPAVQWAVRLQEAKQK